MQSFHDKAFIVEPIPDHMVIPAFGLMMNGDELDLIHALRVAHESTSDDRLLAARPFTYCEVGIASGQTLSAMTDVLENLYPEDWRAFGVDIKNGWSLDLLALWEKLKEREECIEINLEGSEAFFREHVDALDFVLLDGCHECECVKIDFEGAAKRIPTGGIVAFHDSDEIAQGVHPQPHKGEPIGVRRALFDLGLLPGGTKDWKLLADIEANPGSHGVAIFQKRG